jgi:hypothetical protein
MCQRRPDTFLTCACPLALAQSSDPPPLHDTPPSMLTSTSAGPAVSTRGSTQLRCVELITRAAACTSAAEPLNLSTSPQFRSYGESLQGQRQRQSGSTAPPSAGLARREEADHKALEPVAGGHVAQRRPRPRGGEPGAGHRDAPSRGR